MMRFSHVYDFLGIVVIIREKESVLNRLIKMT